MRQFPARSQRLTTWIGPAAQNFLAVASAGATVIASLPFEEPATIMRTRGQVSIAPNVVTADLTIAGAFGICVVSAEAFAAGIAAIPEPFSDADWGGWFVWRSFANKVVASAVDDGIFPAAVTMEIDFKAMRKVTSNEVMVVVAESQIGAFNVFDGTRHLIKLT